jgi:Ca-activated chloride channel family protein
MRTLRAASTAFACLVATAVLTANNAPSSLQQTPTFRSGVQYVEVDVTVLDQKGRLVRTLTKDDFELFEDGVRQDVNGFQLVDIPVPPRQPQKAPRPSRIDRDVTTNTSSGRVYVMLLESPPGVPFGYTYLTQRVARWFVDQALGPDDLMAILHVQGSLTAAQTFTNSRQLLLRSIDALALSDWGGHDIVPEPEKAIASLRTYETMQYVAERLGAIGNRRKAILWVGGVVNFFPNTAEEAVAYREAIRAANRNNVSIYPIDPAGLTIALGRKELERAGALRVVAEDTGGDAIVGTNNFLGGYQRIVEQNSTYYVLGYYPAVERNDGKFHDIKVRVKTTGLVVRARKGYVAPTPASRAAASRPMPAGLSAEAIDGLGSMVPVKGLPLDVFLAPFKGEDGRGSVLLGAKLGADGLEPDERGQIEVSYLTIDSIGTMHPGMRRTFTLNAGPETPQPGRSGLGYFDRLSLPPGRHEVRLVVHQPGGSTGSVIAHVDVPDFVKAPLAMSGIVVASKNETPRRALLKDEAAGRALAADPTVNRRFAPDDVLSLWGEVYDNRKAAASPVQLTIRVAPVVGGMPLMATGRTLTADERSTGRFGYQERLELSRLAPGPYVLTVEAKTTDGKHTSTRQLPFSVAE